MQTWWQKYRLGVAVGVTVTVISAILLTTWHLLVGSWREVWSGVTYPIPVPAILLIALVVLVVYLAWQGYAAGRVARLSKDEERLLSLFVAVTGLPIPRKQLAHMSGLQPLKAERAADSLEKRGFLNIAWDGGAYFLAAKGRDYALDHGYVPAAPEPSTNFGP